MNSKQLRYFVAIAEEHSLSAAAKRLGVQRVTNQFLSQEQLSAGGGAALSKRRGEDLLRAKVAAQQNVQRLAAAE